MRNTTLILILILLTQNSKADLSDKITFVPSIAYQEKTLSFDQKYSGNATNDVKFSTQLPVINLKLTTAIDKFYITLKLETTRADVSTTTTETDRSIFGESTLIALENSKVDVDREDWSLTLSYNAWKSLNIFLGVLVGETTLRPQPFCANPCTRSNRAYIQYLIGDLDPNINQAEYKQFYQEEGPFVGLSYGWPIGDYGTLSASLAYADMDGKYQDNASDPNNLSADPTTGNPTFVAFNYSGKTTGTSIGLTWTGTVSESTAYFFDLRSQQYSMEGVDPNFNNVFLNTDEKMLGVSAGLQFYF